MIIIVCSCCFDKSTRQSIEKKMLKSKPTIIYQIINRNLKSASNYQRLCCATIVAASTKNVPFNLSDIGEGIREVLVKEWYVKVGDEVSQFDKICEVQSDKASVTITSRYDGVVKKLHYNIDDTALVGKPLVDIEIGNESTETAKIKSDETANLISDETEQANNKINETATEEILCLPSVRRLAKENNIDLKLVQGNGKKGRITKEDILKYLNSKKKVERNFKNLDELSEREDKTVEIKGFQKAMVKTMTAALKIPHFMYSDDIIVTKLSQFREDLKRSAGDRIDKLSFMPFFIKATSNALKQYPILNSTVDEKCEKMTLKGQHNIGIAMDTSAGLAVPIIKNVNRLSLIEINWRLLRLMEKGKSGIFDTDDLSGGTFSISNIGVIGGTYMKAVILPPQVAIIALGAVKVQPTVENESIRMEKMMSVSVSADHRVIDGATVARFVQLLKKQIENPYLLVLEGI